MVNTDYAWIKEIEVKCNPFENTLINNLFVDIKGLYADRIEEKSITPSFEDLITFIKTYFAESLAFMVDECQLARMIINVFDTRLDFYSIFKEIDIQFSFFDKEKINDNYDFTSLSDDEMHDLINCNHFPIVDINFNERQLEVLKIVGLVDHLPYLIEEQTGISCITVNGMAHTEIEEDSF